MRRNLILFCTVVLMMFILTGCGQPTVELNKYVNISVDGSNGAGKADYKFDKDAFEKDYAGRIELDMNNKTLSTSIYDVMWGKSPERLLYDYCIYAELNEDRNLSNGDVITLEWDCDDTKAEEYFNVKLEYSNIEYTVEGLKE